MTASVSKMVVATGEGYTTIRDSTIRYAARPMTEDDAARFKAQGHMQAPVVVTEAETWAGYRPDKIIAIPTTP